jgi:hypothetical protein
LLPLTITLADLQSTGPILEVQLGDSLTGQQAGHEHGRPPVQNRVVRALVDTGSDMCAMHNGLASALGLTLMGMQFLGGGFAGGSASTLTPVPEYSARIVFPHGPAFDMTAIEVPLPGGLELLIGRDLLARGHFAYNGLGNSFTLSF